MKKPENIQCAACGQFIPYADMEIGGKGRFHFEPDSHFGPEVCEWECVKCVQKEPSQ